MATPPTGSASSLDKFSFTTATADGTRLSCLLERKPTLTKHSGTCVLLAHGLGQDKSSPAIRALAESLPYNVCTFDARGLGDSSGEASICDYKDAADDINAIVDKLGGLGVTVHTVFGISKGGEAAILFVQQYPSKVRQLITLNIHYDLSRNDECQLTPAQLRQIQTAGYIVWKRYGRNNNPKFWIIRKEDLRLRAAVDVHSPMLRISSHIKILVLHGSENETVPQSEAKKYAEMMAGRPNFSWSILDGVTHACSTPAEIQKVVEVVEQWTERDLPEGGFAYSAPDSGSVESSYFEYEGSVEAPPMVRRSSVASTGTAGASAAPPQPGLSPALLAEFLETPSELAADKWALDSLTPPYTTGTGSGNRSRTNSASSGHVVGPRLELDLSADGADDAGSRRSSVSALSAALSSVGIGTKPTKSTAAIGVSGLAAKAPFKSLSERVEAESSEEEEEQDEDGAFRLSP